MNKHLRNILIVIIVFFSFIVIGTCVSIPIIITNRLSFPTNTNNGKKLTSNEVIKNFEEGGIWYQKTSLVAEDFTDYNGGIAIDCFDNLTNELESVELFDTNSIILNGSNNLSIYWLKVKMIKIKSTESLNKNIFECNNILFFKSGINYCASTITDRINNLTISFPNKSELPVNKLIEISNNFYKEDIFSNVLAIKIDSNAIIGIGNNAFKNCSKLSYLKIELYDTLAMLWIGKSAFYNTNLTLVDINTNNTLYIYDSAFYNCSSLSYAILYSTFYIFLENSSFEKCNPNFTIDILCDSISFFDNVFANQYTNFTFNIQVITTTNCLSLDFSSNTFKNINVNINNFYFKIINDSQAISRDIFNNISLES